MKACPGDCDLFSSSATPVKLPDSFCCVVASKFARDHVCPHSVGPDGIAVSPAQSLLSLRHCVLPVLNANAPDPLYTHARTHTFMFSILSWYKLKSLLSTVCMYHEATVSVPSLQEWTVTGSHLGCVNTERCVRCTSRETLQGKRAQTTVDCSGQVIYFPHRILMFGMNPINNAHSFLWKAKLGFLSLSVHWFGCSMLLVVWIFHTVKSSCIRSTALWLAFFCQWLMVLAQDYWRWSSRKVSFIRPQKHTRAQEVDWTAVAATESILSLVPFAHFGFADPAPCSSNVRRGMYLLFCSLVWESDGRESEIWKKLLFTDFVVVTLDISAPKNFYQRVWFMVLLLVMSGCVQFRVNVSSHCQKVFPNERRTSRKSLVV